MVNHQSSALQTNFAEHINSAYKVLKYSFKVIPSLFPDKEICLMDYIVSDNKDKMIEIRLATATLTCLFDENDICDGSFLFMDDLNDMQHYIDHCNKTYVYNYLLSGWLVEPNYCLRIKRSSDDACLFFFALLPVLNLN